VFVEEATLRPRMADPGGWQPARGDPAHLHPTSPWPSGFGAAARVASATRRSGGRAVRIF